MNQGKTCREKWAKPRYVWHLFSQWCHWMTLVIISFSWEKYKTRRLVDYQWGFFLPTSYKWLRAIRKYHTYSSKLWLQKQKSLHFTQQIPWTILHLNWKSLHFLIKWKELLHLYLKSRLFANVQIYVCSIMSSKISRKETMEKRGMHTESEYGMKWSKNATSRKGRIIKLSSSVTMRIRVTTQTLNTFHWQLKLVKEKQVNLDFVRQ